MSFPFNIFPYSIGVKEIMKVVPSVPCLSISPYLGIIVNSGSDSGVNEAVKNAVFFLWLVNLKETEVVLLRGEEITIRSSSLGAVASSIMRNFHLPPAYLRTLKSKEVLKGFKGSNYISNSTGSDWLSIVFFKALTLKHPLTKFSNSWGISKSKENSSLLSLIYTSPGRRIFIF